MAEPNELVAQLRAAACDGDTARVLALLDAADVAGYTALMHAVSGGFTSVVSALVLQGGARVDVAAGPAG